MESDEHEAPEHGHAIGLWTAHLPGQELVPAYLSSPFAAQYRVIVGVLLEAQDNSLTGLSYDEVAAGIRSYLAERMPADSVDALVDAEQLRLEDRLDRLVRWQVLVRWQEPARTGEDFLRRRDRYQLTPLAARLHTFWSTADDSEETAGDFTLAPRAIHDRLVAFSKAIQASTYRAAASEFQQVSALHLAMATAARTWQRGLAHALSGGPEPEKQELMWRTLQSYVGMWGEQVDVHSPRIADLVNDLDRHLTQAVWRACARSAMSDDAPDELVQSQATRWAHTWTALSTWFDGAHGQARRLRRQLRDLVAPWARNTHILMDTGGAITRRADLFRLAAAIERAPDESTAWRIWDTAVGQFSARHLLLPADAIEDPTLSWADAPAAPVTARFREQGVKSAVGRRATVPDYTKGRAEARRARLAELAVRSAAEASLRQRSGTNLRSWRDLTDAELDLLLDYIGTVRRTNAATPAGAPRSAVTGDGRWSITLHPPNDPGDTTTLRSPSGTLAIRNWRFHMAAT